MHNGQLHTPIIEARNIRHRYTGVLALDQITVGIDPGSFTAILGPNGAGKSTLAQILGGLLKPSAGTLHYSNVPANAHDELSMVRHGVCLVPEGRRLFGQLTIEDNLLVAGYGVGLKRKVIRKRIKEVAEILPPALRDGMASRLAMSLSGGERQMLALSRALMSDPRLIILDEPSMGLAPIMVDRVYEILSGLRSKGVAVVVVEQIATHALEHADTLHLLARGHIVYSGPTSDAAAAEAIKSSYVGHVEETSV